ncbi:MAG: TSUP family transporter [Bdellovibrionales bacterium]
MFDIFPADASASPLLVFVGLVAGIIEATAGGSGLVVVPTLLALGVPPVPAMATSKLQYIFGASASIFRFSRANLIPWRKLAPLVIAAGAGGAIGAYALSRTQTEILETIIPILLILAALYFIFSPRLSDKASAPRFSYLAFALGPVVIIGFYDGFFGVGSASFLVMSMVWGLGLAIREATAATKVVDFTSTVGALAVLASANEVLWQAGIFLGAGQIVGAWIGAGLVIRHGVTFVRPVLAAVSIGLSVYLLV